MTVIGADRVMRKLSQLPKSVKDEVDKAVAQSGSELIRIAKVLVHSPNGQSREAIHGTAQADGSYLVDFGPLSKILEGGRDDPRADPSGKNIGTSAAHPFVNPALSVTRKKHKARAKRAVNKAVKAVFNG